MLNEDELHGLKQAIRAEMAEQRDAEQSVRAPKHRGGRN